MGRGRGSRTGRSSRASNKQAIENSNASECAELLSVPSTVTLPPKALETVVEESESTPSTTSPSHADTAVSTPTSNGTLMASVEDATSDEAKAEKMVSDLLTQTYDEFSKTLTSAANPTAPWALPGESISTSGAYREHLRSRGRIAMHGSDLWRPIAIAEATAETGVTPNESMSAAQALGLMWNASPTAAYSPEPVAQLQFDASARNVNFTMPPPVPPMPPQMPTPSVPMPSMHIPANPMIMLPESCDVSQLLAIAMPGPLGGLSNSQIEEQLRAAAAQIQVYDD